MGHPTYRHPLDPYVRKNPFRGRLPRPQSILTFAEARPRLPVPVLPDRPALEEMYWRAWEMAWTRLRRPRPGSGFVSSYVDMAIGDCVNTWDSAFVAQFGLYGRRVFNFTGTLDNFYARQHDDGFICREVNAEQGSDFFYPFDPNGAGPNILSWAEWRYYRLTGDDSRLAEVFWPLMGLHYWFRAHRTWPGGLYWATGLSSAMDNQPRIPEEAGNGLLHHCHWTWVDANMQAALNGLALSQMAAHLGELALAEELNAERLHLAREVNARLWNEAAGFYQDVDAAGRFSLAKSIGAYWALLDRDMVPQERLALFLRHLREPAAFKRPHRAPSLSADSPGYDGETGNCWQGAVWPPTNFMLLKGLRAVGQHALAHEIAANHLENICSVFQHTDTLWENYAPEAARPGEPARPGPVRCTGLPAIAVLLEDVIGLSVDWPLRRVVWDRRLETAGPYGVRNYPLGPDGALDLVGDNQAVTVTSNVPFNLTIQNSETSLQMAVPAGTTTIQLR
ncbi:MAG: glycoside hydrolase [Chloroflexi bacterium]|nr:glycoside hydrolase [Chloroflexota bacterium]MCI0578948.1 glycoside hydrolase [Chloroflexota bacterium]MCI0646885.1 glycoside hydrolase [Chloroflexota bacterium]MCI0730797.1 glycoside hydrolase [Chloroflexota bacterium]